MAAAAKSAALPSLYSELNRFGTHGDFDRALNAASKILSQAPEEEDAFRCKVICLIQLSKFAEALQIINKNPAFAKNLIFEKAYTQYRLNQPAEALKTLKECSTLDSKLKELKAQILYRLEQYEDSYDLYREIIKNTSDDYEDEREANLAAAIVNIAIENPAKKLPQLRETTYELVYNSACLLVSRCQFTEAEKKLKAAEKLCRETLEEDGASEEDIETELGIIRCQLAYTLQIQGREKEAQSLYNSILKTKPSDIGLVAIASNNSAAINREQNVFDSKKKMKSATAEGVEHKLSSRQKSNIAFNHCLLTVFTNQNELFKGLNKKLELKYPDMKADALLLRAVHLFWEGQVTEAATLLENADVGNVQMKLAAVHMLLTAGERKDACRVLEKVLVESEYQPGIIGALVTLYMANNERDLASKVFKNAVEWYKKSQSGGKSDLSALWRQAADFHLRGGEPQVAAQSLEELLRSHPNDTKILAQLIIAYSNFDPGKAQTLSKKLPSCTLTNAAEIDALETSNWMMGTKVIKKVAKVEASPKTGSGGELIQKKNKAKKKRKPRLPKNYQPGTTPDPERWLPKHERTGYRKKKDRRVKEVMKGSQGAATGASDMYDMSKMAAKSSPVPSSPNPEPQGPRQQQKKYQPKKKKVDKLDSFRDKSLSLQDTAFVDYLEEDIKVFIQDLSNERVLVFPPVSNFRRFLIHKLVEESFPDLKTFSVGVGDDRRTVVCFKTDYKPEEAPSQSTQAAAEGKIKPPKRPRTMPSVGIYLPPAARKELHTSDNAGNPDPVPEQKSCDNDIKTSIISPELPSPVIIEKAPERRGKNRRPDMAVYVPRGQRIAQENQRKLEAMAKSVDGVELRLEDQLITELAKGESKRVETPQITDNDGESRLNIEMRNSKNEDLKKCSQKPTADYPLREKVDNLGDGDDSNLVENYVEGRGKIDQEFFKQSTVHIANGSQIPCETGDGKHFSDKSEELDWDVLYDDSGECLDPSLMSQLTSAVGRVKIEKPKLSYDGYKHQNFDEEFPHVVEVYNFPPEFKTPDLVMIFSDFKNSGFEIKWVDDTHALGIFSSATIVAEVLKMQHPLVKTRSLSEGSQQSKNKARRCADSLTPYVPRPDTCAALARRLVTGALGVKLPNLRAEREAERKILHEAREKKRLAARQREEAWEGTFS